MSFGDELGLVRCGFEEQIILVGARSNSMVGNARAFDILAGNQKLEKAILGSGRPIIPKATSRFWPVNLDTSELDAYYIARESKCAALYSSRIFNMGSGTNHKDRYHLENLLQKHKICLGETKEYEGSHERKQSFGVSSDSVLGKIR